MYVTLSSRYLNAVEQKRVKAKKSRLVRLTETGAILEDGTEMEVDCIILATGYKNSL